MASKLLPKCHTFIGPDPCSLVAKSDHLLSFDHPFSLRTLSLARASRKTEINCRAKGKNHFPPFLPPLTTTFTPRGGQSVIGLHYGTRLSFRGFCSFREIWQTRSKCEENISIMEQNDTSNMIILYLF